MCGEIVEFAEDLPAEARQQIGTSGESLSIDDDKNKALGESLPKGPSGAAASSSESGATSRITDVLSAEAGPLHNVRTPWNALNKLLRHIIVHRDEYQTKLAYRIKCSKIGMPPWVKHCKPGCKNWNPTGSLDARFPQDMNEKDEAAIAAAEYLHRHKQPNKAVSAEVREEVENLYYRGGRDARPEQPQTSTFRGRIERIQEAVRQQGGDEAVPSASTITRAHKEAVARKREEKASGGSQPSTGGSPPGVPSTGGSPPGVPTPPPPVIPGKGAAKGSRGYQYQAYKGRPKGGDWWGSDWWGQASDWWSGATMGWGGKGEDWSEPEPDVAP